MSEETEPGKITDLDPDSVREAYLKYRGKEFQKKAKEIYTPDSDPNQIEVFNRDKLPWQRQYNTFRNDKRNAPKRGR